MNEEKIKNYFLGKLPEAESETLEEEISLGAELTEQAQIVENELVDDYLRGNLSASESRLFEAIYLVTEARREKLNSAKSVWKVAGEQKVYEIAETENPKSFWQNWNALRFAFTAFAAVLLLGAGIFFWINSRNKEEIVKQQNINQSPTPKVENRNVEPIENSNAVNQNVNIATNLNKNLSPTPAKSPTPTTTPSSRSVAPNLATFTLLPGTLRSEGEQVIKITPNTNKINLRLTQPKDAIKYQNYTATIKTADGETIFTAPNLKSLSLVFPVNKLENRTYTIFLEGNNPQKNSESIAEYTFRVRR